MCHSDILICDLEMVENIVEKGKNAGRDYQYACIFSPSRVCHADLPTFSPFSTKVSKAFLDRVVEPGTALSRVKKKYGCSVGKLKYPQTYFQKI